MEVTV